MYICVRCNRRNIAEKAQLPKRHCTSRRHRAISVRDYQVNKNIHTLNTRSWSRSLTTINEEEKKKELQHPIALTLMDWVQRSPAPSNFPCLHFRQGFHNLEKGKYENVWSWRLGRKSKQCLPEVASCIDVNHPVSRASSSLTKHFSKRLCCHEQSACQIISYWRHRFRRRIPIFLASAHALLFPSQFTLGMFAGPDLNWVSQSSTQVTS